MNLSYLKLKIKKDTKIYREKKLLKVVKKNDKVYPEEKF